MTSRRILLRMRNVPVKRCKEYHNTHFMFNNFFPPENRAAYEIMRVFRAFPSVVRQIPGYNSPRWGTPCTVPITFLCCSMDFLFFCRSVYCLCVNVYCHRVSTQLQLTNISNIKYMVELNRPQMSQHGRE
jgi:hypothetical protein